MADPATDEAIRRLIALDAAGAVPAGIDLWPAIAERVLPGEDAIPSSAGSLLRQIGPPQSHARDWSPARTRSPLTPRSRLPYRDARGAFAVAVMSLLAIALSVAALRLSTGNAPLDEFRQAAAPPSDGGCTIDFDASLPKTAAAWVDIVLRVAAASGCPKPHTLRVEITNSDGTPAPISGNPVELPLIRQDDRYAGALSLRWRNWCAGPARYRLRVSIGTDANTLSIPDTPPCIDPLAPSTLRQQPWPGTPVAVGNTPVR